MTNNNCAVFTASISEQIGPTSLFNRDPDTTIPYMLFQVLKFQQLNKITLCNGDKQPKIPVIT